MAIPVLLLTLSASVFGQDKTPGELIRELGSEDYFERTQAEKRLLEIGADAISAVKAARFNSDHEIRLRTRRLYPKILKAARRQKIEQFLESEESDLPGWNAFANLVSAEKSSRELFSTLYESSPEAWDAVESNDFEMAKSQTELLYTRSVSTQFRTLESFSLLFVSCFEFESGRILTSMDPKKLVSISTRLASSYTLNFLDATDYRATFDVILSEWLAQLPDESPTLRSSKLRVIDLFELTSMAEEIVELAANPANGIHLRAQALALLGKIGSKKNLPAIASTLDDSSIVGHFPVLNSDQRTQVQLRDLSLAVHLYLNQLPLEEYGFPVKDRSTLGKPFIPVSKAGFVQEPQRIDAFRKWEQYVKEQASGSPGG